MKKVFSVILAIVFLFTASSFSGIYVSADDAIKGEEFYYTLDNGEVTIVSIVDLEATDVVIPEEIDGCPVTAIGEYAFNRNYSIISVTIPDSVEIIGEAAFYDCYFLETLKIGKGVRTVSNNAFYSCNYLKSVYISDIAAWCEIEFANDRTNPVSSSDLYLNETLVTDLVIPEGVTEIKDWAFLACSSIKSVTIPSTVKTVGNAAFGDCVSLESVTMGDGVEEIKSFAFNFCETLKSVELSSNLKILGEGAFRTCMMLDNVVVPEGVTYIGDEAFSYCLALENVSLPDTVDYIGEDAFADTKCCFLWENGAVYIGKHLIHTHPEAEGDFVIKEGTLTVAQYAFYQSPKIETVTLPMSIKNINGYAFYYTGIKKVYYRLDQTGKEKINITEDGNSVLINAEWDYDSCLGRADHSFENFGYTKYCTVCFTSGTCVGDLTGDTYVNTSDLATMKLLLAGVGEFTEFLTLLADINGDGMANTSDLASLKLKLAGN